MGFNSEFKGLMILCSYVRFVMCKVSMYCKTVSDKMLEDGASITNPLFRIIILLLLGKR